jgi:hypothetical protein
MARATFASWCARLYLIVVASCGSTGSQGQMGGTGSEEPVGGAGGANMDGAATGGSRGEGGTGAGGAGGANTGGAGGADTGGRGGANTGGTGGASTSGAGGANTGVPDAAPAADSLPPPGLDGGSVGASGFKHPGVVVSRGQLDFLKAKIAAGEQPWTGIADALKRQSYASPTYKAKPVPNVICGPYSNPSVGCADEWRDGMAAYAQAMLWYVTGDESYAKNAIAIMNAWSSTLEGHSNSNGPLQQGWAGAMWPRGAEIIRHTYGGWSAADIARFETMLKTQYLPGVINGSGANGNWELTMIDAAIAIGVFLDDKAAFDKAVTMWRQRVPAYFYMSSDGPRPVPAPRGSTNWNGATVFMDGISQETCRDLTHTQYGIASAMYVAETALIQGVDLYAEQAKRLATTVEFHAGFLDGVPPPAWLCGGSLAGVTARPTWEIAYNHFANRLGMPLPHTRNLVMRIRPTGGDHHMSWESMSHAQVGWAGLQAR